MNEQDQMRQFAENLWNQFFANKVDKAMSQTVSYFRARVTDNPGSGKLEVQRPFDTAHIVSCTDALSNASAGDEVTVFVFGSENGNNAVAVSDGSMSTLGSGGGGGGSVAWSDVTGKPTTISGYGITDAKIVTNTITLGGNSVTVPTVNDATLTIQKNGTTVETFTANASSNATANITVPTTTSELTNNSGFITSADLTTDIITNVSASTWVADSTYTGFDYKCDIDVTGYDVDSTSFAEVTFDADEAVSGDYAPVCTTGTDTVTIYSKVNTAITIPSILIVRAS